MKSTVHLNIFLSAIFLSIGFLPAVAHGQDAVIRAGAAVADITPLKLPISMTGSFTDRKAAEVHDRLFARSLVLDDGRTSLSITVCDSCLIPAEVYDMAKAAASRTTGIPADHMLMSATHTHTAPTAYAMAQCMPDPEYLLYLARQIAASVQQAYARLAPAQVAWGAVDEPAEVFNRRWKIDPAKIPPDPFGNTTDRVRTNPGILNPDLREPAGPVDPAISFLSVRSASGEPLAVLASYSLHYVGGIPGNSLSADYFGEFARQLAERYNSKSFVGMLANGTSGDINNIDVRKAAPRAAPFERVRQVASAVSEKVFAAAAKIPHRTHVPLAMIEREITLAIRRPNAEQLARARQTLATAEREKTPVVPRVYAQEALELARGQEKYAMKLQAVRVGELAIVAEPCEAFAEVGLEIKHRSPFPATFAIGLANGYGGYLPTPAQHDLGGYETWPSRWSFLEREASVKMVDTLIEMLQAIKTNTARE